jgi:hypothetical protein
MPTLYVGFDVFFPSVYDRTATTPAGSFYIVLQPVIFEASDPDAVGLDTYFTYSGSDIGTTIAIKPLTSDIAARLKGENKILPVPFPPETTVQFDGISWDGLATPIQIPANGSARVIGGIATTDHPSSSPFLLERAHWPHFAVANNAAPTIDSWEKLDADMLPAALAWVAAVAGRVAHKQAANAGPLSDNEKKVYALLVNAGLASGAPLTDRAMRTLLQKSPPNAAAQIYDLFIAANDQGYQPQRFNYTEQGLIKDPTPLFGDLESAGHQIVSLSYHYRLWHLFAAKINELVGSTRDSSKADPVRAALRRLFAFGERLYWPRQDDESFMRCADPGALGWICTNAHSLLGQCFGFTLPLNAKLKNFTVSLKIQGQPISAPPLINGAGTAQIGMLEGAQNAIIDWYAAGLRPQITASLDLDIDPNFKAGFFLFQPKMSACTQSNISDSAKVAYAVSSALLDAADPTARWDQPSGGTQMTSVNPPRIGLLRSEIYEGKSLLPDGGGQYTPYLRLRVALRRIPVPLLPSTAVPPRFPAAYEMTPAMPPLDSEEPAIVSLFNNFEALVAEASAAKPGPELLITQPNGTFAPWTITTGRLVKPALKLPQMTAVLADDAGFSLANLLTPPSSGPGSRSSSTDPNHATCDLLVALDPKDTDKTPMNLFVCDAKSDDGVGPMIILNSVFTSRLSRSTDRLQERVAISLSPWPNDLTDPKQYVASHLSNFNLLRMSVTSTDAAVVNLTPSDDPDEATVVHGPPDKAQFNLTITDALLPMVRPAAPQVPLPPPWLRAWPWDGKQAPQFGYFVSHIFTQDMRGSTGAEALRYVNYLTPQIQWNLVGGIAHQYGQAFAVTDPSALTLPLTTDISHPALDARSLTTADPTKPRSAFLTWSLSGEPISGLQLVFPTAYLRIVSNSGTGNNGSDNIGALSDSPARYRAIYEPLAEFLRCLDNTDTEARVVPARGVPGLTLRMEGWVFNGTAAAAKRLDPSAPTDEPPPVVIDNMRMLGAAELVLTPAVLAKQAANGIQLQSLRQLLQQPFGGFVKSVENLAAGTSTDWAMLGVPLDGWTPDGAKLDPEGLIAAADLVRLGLTLIRPKATVVPSPKPVLPGFGMGASGGSGSSSGKAKTRSAKLLSGIGDFSDLEPAAADELARYLDDSPHATTILRQRFGWLRPHDGGLTGATTTPRPATPLGSPVPAVSVATLVGDVAPFVTRRPKALPNVDTVLTVRYVPVAFRPLAPNPSVGDTGAVEEFVAFLLGIIADIVAGSTPTGVKISDLIGAGDVEKMYNLRARVLSLYREGTGATRAISALLTDLIYYVEYRDPDNQPLKYFMGQADSTLGQADGGWKAAISILLDQTPNLYADAQGFAVALVDRTTGKDSWNDGVMALQIIKTVPTTTGKNAILDRIVFTRIHGRPSVPFFIDTFDTARYHDEFWIDRNGYVPASPPDGPPAPVKFSQGYSLLSRGDTEARIADDFLRGMNQFDNPLVAGMAGTPQRTLEAEVVPYDDVWQKSDPKRPTNRGIYMLPARQFPDTPTIMIPAPTPSSSDGGPVWRTAMNLTFAPGIAPDLTSTYWGDLTSQILTQTVTFSGAIAGTSVTAKQLPNFQYPPAKPADGQVPVGWWYLDTFATHHHFHVTADTADATPFKRDSFRIEVERSRDPFPLDPETPGATTPPPSAGLLAWFQYQRLLDHDRKSGGEAPPGSITAPAPITSDALLADLGSWLAPGGNGILRPLVVQPAAAMPNTRTFMYVPSAEGPPTLHAPGTPGIGDVIAVDMLALGDGSGGYVLRVVVVDDAWNYSRIRVTHLRNEITIGGKPEFAPEFAMESPASAWSTFGRQPLNVDFTSAQIQSRNLPQAIASVRAGMTVGAYLDRTQSIASYGSAVSSTCQATFKSATGQSWTMWNSSELASASYTVRGTVLHERLDLHARLRLVGAQTKPAPAEPQRNEDVPRQFLPVGSAVTADKIDDLVKTINKGQVPGLHQKLRVSWYNFKGEEVLSAVWPVIFDI